MVRKLCLERTPGLIGFGWGMDLTRKRSEVQILVPPPISRHILRFVHPLSG